MESDAGWQAKIKEMEQNLKTGKLDPPAVDEIKQSYRMGHVVRLLASLFHGSFQANTGPSIVCPNHAAELPEI